jgi:hypothetical protein
MKPKVETSKVTTSSSNVKPRSPADQITTAISSFRVHYEVDSNGMEIDGRNQFSFVFDFFYGSAIFPMVFQVLTALVFGIYGYGYSYCFRITWV